MAQTMLYTPLTKACTLLSHTLGCVFIVSSMMKAVNVQGFAQTVSAFLSMLECTCLLSWALHIALAVCAVEAMAGFLLWHTAWRPWASVGLLVMMLAFTLLTWRNYTYTYGQIESCGCFGELLHLSPGASLVKNVGLLLVTVLLAIGSLSQLAFRALACLASRRATRRYLWASVVAGTMPSLFSLTSLTAMPARAYVSVYVSLCVVLGLLMWMLARNGSCNNTAQ